MTTLAEEFVNDMNDLESLEPVKKEEQMDGAEGDDIEEESPNYSKLSNTEINQLLNDIQHLGDKLPESHDPNNLENALIIRANEMIKRINLEISSMYKIHVREIYCKRFPELEHQVFNPLDYTRVVRKLGNNLNKINELSDILPASNIITISMTASSTSGKNLSDEELNKVIEACDFILDLDESRQKILSYVESRMKIFAPNLTEIVGSEIAAKLIGAAGSLHTLATMPSGNIQVLGRTKRALSGFSKVGVQKLGFIGECEIIQSTPPQLEVKACRVIANKCSLAARLDLMHGKQLNGEVGLKFREEIERTIEKWQEPPPARKEKPLRAPDDILTKRRGGQKMKKRRDRYAPTELSKKANRLPFAKITEDHGNTMKSLGMLGLEGSGQIRLNVRDEKGMKLRKKKVKGTATTVDGGFATSVYAITPMQGLELRAQQTRQEEKKPVVASTPSYFANTGFFKKPI